MDDAVEYTKCMDKDKKLRSENGKINQIRKDICYRGGFSDQTQKLQRERGREFQTRRPRKKRVNC